MKSSIPLVFCYGLFGWTKGALGGKAYFVSAEKLKSKLKEKIPNFIFPSTGPISSLHDQACELFFQLKGGITDYGEQHSRKFNHKRFSRFYGNEKYFDSSVSTKYGGEPLYTKWSKEYPLDFIGHSMGVPLITTLQQMLADDYFNKYCGFTEHTDADWVHSVTSISGVHNGSHLTWILGADEETGILKNKAKIIRKICKTVDKSGKEQIKKQNGGSFFDLHLDQWEFNQNKINEKFYDGKDWAMYNLTPNYMEKHNQKIIEYPNTWYFSYCSKATFSLFGLYEFFIPFICHAVLWINALRLGNYKTKNEKWKQLIKQWHKNDGMCPVDGQKFPYLGRDLNSIKINKFNFSDIRNIKKGVWNVMDKVLYKDHPEQAMFPHWWMERSNLSFYEKIIKVIIYTNKMK